MGHHAGGNERFFRGTLTFGAAPDADELAKAVEVYRTFGCELELEAGAGRAGLVYEFGMRGLGTVPGWLHDLLRGAAEDESVELCLDYRVDDMRRFFGCDVECREFRPRMGEGGGIDLAAKLCRRRSPFDRDHGAKPASVGRGGGDSLEAALGELDAMIGLEAVKRQVHDIASIARNRGAGALPCMHMVFTGNPGTGKTEVARILARVLKSLGALETGAFVETDRSGLVGQYVGHTALKTKAAIDSARGGVLFVDEAYSLGLYAGDLGAHPDGAGGRRDFGPEAVDALVKEMEGGGFVCVMAGYPREMEAMMSCNPGLRDRVGFFVEFPDYDEAELAAVFSLMVSKRGYGLSAGASEEAERWIARASSRRGADFGNARLMRRLADRAIFKQNVRTPGSLVEACDVAAAAADPDLAGLAEMPSAHATWSGNPVGFSFG